MELTAFNDDVASQWKTLKLMKLPDSKASFVILPSEGILSSRIELICNKNLKLLQRLTAKLTADQIRVPVASLLSPDGKIPIIIWKDHHDQTFTIPSTAHIDLAHVVQASPVLKQALVEALQNDKSDTLELTIHSPISEILLARIMSELSSAPERDLGQVRDFVTRAIACFSNERKGIEALTTCLLWSDITISAPLREQLLDASADWIEEELKLPPPESFPSILLNHRLAPERIAAGQMVSEWLVENRVELEKGEEETALEWNRIVRTLNLPITINLSARPFTDAIGPYLNQLTNLKALCLDNTEVSSAVGPHLPASLVTLSAANTKIRNDFPITHLKMLRELNLSYNPILDSMGSILCELTELRSLSIRGARLTGTLAEKLPPLLEKLDLSLNPIPHSIDIAHLSQLRDLDLSFTSIGTQIAGVLNQMPQLCSLRLKKTGASDALVRQLPTSLKFLDLSQSRITDLVDFSSLTQLTELCTKHCLVGNQFILKLPQSLRRLNIKETSISDEADLSHLNHLVELSVKQCGSITGHVAANFPPSLEALDIGGTGITEFRHFSKLVGLKALFANECVFTSADLGDHLPTGLTELSLQGTPVDDQFTVERLTSLQSLSICRVDNLTNAFIAKIPPSIESLDLEGAAIDDNVLLSRLVNLKELDVTDCSLLSNALARQLPPSIRALRAEGTQINKRIGLPGVAIYFTPDS